MYTNNSPTVALMRSTGFLKIGEKFVGGVRGGFGWGSQTPNPWWTTLLTLSWGPMAKLSAKDGSPLSFAVNFYKCKN